MSADRVARFRGDIQVVLGVIQPIAATVDWDNQYWVHGGDEGFSYCRECCEKEAAKVKAKKPKEHICVDGGWEYFVSDSRSTCDSCNVNLTYALTEYGAEQEFSHFRRQRKFDFSSPDLCFELDAMLSAMENFDKPEPAMVRFVERLRQKVVTQ